MFKIWAIFEIVSWIIVIAAANVLYSRNAKGMEEEE